MKKKTANNPTRDREFAVILERIYSEIKILGEGQQAIRAKLDTTADKLDDTAAKLDVTAAKLDVTAAKLDVTAEKLDATMEMVGKNAEGITSLRFLYNATKDDITKINGKLTNIEELLHSFDKRISVLESLPK